MFVKSEPQLGFAKMLIVIPSNPTCTKLNVSCSFILFVACIITFVQGMQIHYIVCQFLLDYQ